MHYSKTSLTSRPYLGVKLSSRPGCKLPLLWGEAQVQDKSPLLWGEAQIQGKLASPWGEAQFKFWAPALQNYVGTLLQISTVLEELTHMVPPIRTC